MNKQDLDAIIQPLTESTASHHIFFGDIESWIDRLNEDTVVNLIPDFQRGHVWTESQQKAFIESVLKGVVKDPIIRFNNRFWMSSKTEGDLPDEFVCIDGLQRLTAIRKFMKGEILPFGLSIDQLKGTAYSPFRSLFAIHVHIYQFGYRKDLLNFYLALNAGGTVHSESEIERVKGLLKEVM